MVESYLEELARRVRGVLGAEVVGVYAGGSYALGAYAHGRSDLDIAAVVGSPPTREARERLVEALRHENFPCPARGLEFVLYRLDEVDAPSPRAAFELNLNTGERMPFRADFEPSPDEQHWFPIDRSILREHGVALYGPPASDVFAPLPRKMLLQLVLDSVRWHSTDAARPDDTVLNACRAWRFAREGRWSSKPEAGAWALREHAPSIVAEALEARKGGGRLDVSRVRGFVAFVAGELERAASDAASRKD